MNYSMEYEKASKLARGEQLKSRMSGSDGFLKSLDSVIKNIDIVAEVPIGVNSILLKKVVGTYYFTRSRDFSEEYLPLKNINTEFADKWKSLCEAHITEGIREPIKVYEFMNEYYVLEGNKRVSVLKYFEAHSIEADVTRLIPKKDESDPYNKLYYEFLDFSNKTGIYDIWFNKRIFFKELLNYLDDFNPEVLKGRDKYEHFHKNFYVPFRILYKEYGGDNLEVTTGDAVLEYIRTYGIDSEFDYNHSIRINRILQELKLTQNKSQVEIQTRPFEVQKGTVFNSISQLVISKEKLKVAFLFEKSIDESAWAYSHEKGRMFAQDVLSSKINTCVFENISVNDEEAYNQVKNIAERNFDIIISTSGRTLRGMLRAAMEFEDTKFFCCSPSKAFKNMSTFFGRIHEPMFLLGVLAGIKTKTDVIGCIEKQNEISTITGINAFAIGVKAVNENAKVIVKWTEDHENKEMKNSILQELGKAKVDYVLKRGVTERGMSGRNIALYDLMQDDDLFSYANPVAWIKWDWSKFYEKLLRNISNGNWKGMFSTEAKRVSFVWGIDSGIIDIGYSKELNSKTLQRTIKVFRKSIIDNEIHAFEGPIKDNGGRIRIDDGNYASYNKIIYMDWFVDNIDGIIIKNFKNR